MYFSIANLESLIKNYLLCIKKYMLYDEEYNIDCSDYVESLISWTEIKTVDQNSLKPMKFNHPVKSQIAMSSVGFGTQKYGMEFVEAYCSISKQKEDDEVGKVN